METYLARDLVELKRKVLAVGGLVEDAFTNACRSLLARDDATAARVPKLDLEIEIRTV